MTNNTLSAAYKEGMTDFILHGFRYENPYAKGCDEHMQYETGFYQQHRRAPEDIGVELRKKLGRSWGEARSSKSKQATKEQYQKKRG